MRSILLFFITFFYYIGFTAAQPYVVGGKTRHRFAQTNIGVDYSVLLKNGSESFFINSSGTAEKFELKNQNEARLIIGGTHFWGHSDFYIALPITSFDKSGFSTKIETGAKYFPWRIENRKIRPFIGSAIQTVQFKQGNGASQIRSLYPINLGFIYNYKKHLFELEAEYFFDNKEDYYINPTTSVQIKTQPFCISLSYKYMIDLTLSLEKDWLSGKTKKLTDSLNLLHRLDGITIAIGPSASFFLKSSPHNENVAPYLDNHKITNIFPEFGLGYYLSNPNLQFNFSYRSMKSKIDAYDFTQEANRKAFTFEVCKFICDYNGFDAFIGPAVSYEWLNVVESNQSVITSNQEYNGVKPGITFGWDICPTKMMLFYIRTNLRYFPNLSVRMDDSKNVFLDQLEFNFFQLVFFPGRIGFRKLEKF